MTHRPRSPAVQWSSEILAAGHSVGDVMRLRLGDKGTSCRDPPSTFPHLKPVNHPMF